jgi:hypothetical protein
MRQKNIVWPAASPAMLHASSCQMQIALPDANIPPGASPRQPAWDDLLARHGQREADLLVPGLPPLNPCLHGITCCADGASVSANSYRPRATETSRLSTTRKRH